MTIPSNLAKGIFSGLNYDFIKKTTKAFYRSDCHCFGISGNFEYCLRRLSIIGRVLSRAMQLNQQISVLPGIGPKTVSKYHQLEIYTLKDLINHAPVRHDDLSHPTPIKSLMPNAKYIVRGTLSQIASKRLRSKLTMQTAMLADETDRIKVTWFNQPYLTNQIKPDIIYNLHISTKIYAGKLSAQGLSVPITAVIKSPHTNRLVPRYRQTEGLTSKAIRTHIYTLLQSNPTIPDYYSDTISRFQAYQNLHFPPDTHSLKQAHTKLATDELIVQMLAAMVQKSEWAATTTGVACKSSNHQTEKLLHNLPFTLTDDQQQAIDRVLADMNSHTPMHRLLQGDVGAGKTIVALAGLVRSYENGYNALLMAPTEVLATQHFETIKRFVAPLKIPVYLETRNSKNKSPSGIIVGTHAILHRPLPNPIGLVVIDEQHRFGVNQRNLFKNMSPSPHMLTMTATPIPRTLALTLYSQLEITRISQKPKGRKPIITRIVQPTNITKANQWMTHIIQKYQAQAFIVTPFIQNSTKPEFETVAAAEAEYLQAQKDFPMLKIGLLHGKLSKIQKESVLDQFAHKQLDILVATPVIEVGIDIPNARIIAIKSADRFGLASLHQLRGRVGRSDVQSYCLLFSTNEQTKRLQYLESIDDGLQLAEIDAKMRGSGNILGSQQSGFHSLKFADINDTQQISHAHRQASSLMEQSPDLSNYPILKTEITSILENSSKPA